jgi:tripartite-type tricarboxylate transporter receptor subunit TctC
LTKGAVAGALCLGRVANAPAQDYPVKPVRIVVPYAAGGGTDALARFLAGGLERRLGQPFIIENRPGQGTATGAAHVARAAPDGYTLLAATSSTLAFNPSVYKKLPYDPVADFSLVSLIAAVPFVLVVNPALPVGSVAELVALAKAKPGALSYGSGGMGAPHHIYMELFKSMTGTDIKHIPYRGGGPALNDVVAGHVPMMFGDVAPVTGLVREGRVKALGVTVGSRVESIPDVPTMVEAGLAGYEASSEHGRACEPQAVGRRRAQRRADRLPGRASHSGAFPQARHAADVEHAGGVRQISTRRDRKMGADHQGGGRDRGLRRARHAQRLHHRLGGSVRHRHHPGRGAGDVSRRALHGARGRGPLAHPGRLRQRL